MQRAIDLAERGLYTASPNPRVGCVIVSSNKIIAEGFHQQAGQGHAEVNALADAAKKGRSVIGATAYVTLEPCSHTGKTPPCCDALIDAELSRVVIAMQDPNPLVAGSGIERLTNAGIQVDLGILEIEAKALNPGFIKRMQQNLPWVRVKLAMSLDGRTAMASGESQWITGPQARSDVQRLRARSCAVISGVDTVLIDNASLTVRAEQLGLADKALVDCIVAKQPLRVILDSQLRLPADANILAQPGNTLVVAAKRDESKRLALEAAGATVLEMPNKQGQVDLQVLLKYLSEQQCNEILVEAGATLAGAFIEQQLVDQLHVYMAPTLLGSNARPLLDLPLQMMSEQQRLKIQAITAVGDDWRIDAELLKNENNR